MTDPIISKVYLTMAFFGVYHAMVKFHGKIQKKQVFVYTLIILLIFTGQINRNYEKEKEEKKTNK